LKVAFDRLNDEHMKQLAVWVAAEKYEDAELDELAQVFHGEPYSRMEARRWAWRYNVQGGYGRIPQRAWVRLMSRRPSETGSGAS
jgi:hypothetical protein